MSEETAKDLRYQQGKDTSLGGMRPKCTVLDEVGWLATGKFPSVKEERCVTRGEILAFLYRGNGLWQLSPTFDLNPFRTRTGNRRHG